MSLIRQLVDSARQLLPRENHRASTESISYDVERLEPRMMLSAVDIYAAGATGNEQLELLIGNQVAATWTSVAGSYGDRIFEKLRFETDQTLTADQISVRFANDAFDPATGYDQNLYVDRIVLDGRVYQAEHSATYTTAFWNNGIEAGNFATETLNATGQFNFSSTGVQSYDRILVTALGSTGDEQLQLLVDDVAVGGTTVASNRSVYQFELNSGVVAEQIKVAFTNDSFQPDQNYDRNLSVLAIELIDSDTLESKTISTGQVNVFSTGVWTTADGIQQGYNRGNTLHTNGYFSFASTEDRQIDGARNNVSEELFDSGAADSTMPRFSDYTPNYGGDGFGDEIVDDRPNARDISNTIVRSDRLTASSGNLSDMVWLWGQFLDHDLDLSTTEHGLGANGTAAIAMNDPADPLGPRPIEFTRSNFTVDDKGYRQQINAITSFIDASNVYGSDYARANSLRTFAGGKLKVDTNNLLPTGINVANEDGGLGAADLFVAGDVRANENVALAAMHTLFVREHNRLADMIADQRPSYSDEQIYQLARKIVGAQMQIITYEQFLPALLGEAAPSADEFSYDESIDPSIVNSFAHAAYRFGHSMLAPSLQLAKSNGQVVGAIPLKDAFFNPGFLHDDPGRIDLLLQGMMNQRAQEIDVHIVEDVRSFLFGPPGAGGLDLASLNIQRGRDHGLPDYNSLRGIYGLSRVDSFADITRDADLQSQLAGVYGDVDSIDPWIGGLAEDHLPGANMGELLTRVIGGQFQRLRDGDRLFYTSNDLGLYQNGQLRDEIRSIIDLDSFSLSDVLAANANVNPSANPFFVEPGTTLVINAYSSEPDGQFIVRSGDRTLGTFQTTTIDNSFLINVPLAGFEGSIQIEFINDEYVPGEFDRNLIVESIEFGSVVIASNSESVFSTGTWRAEDGIASGFGRGNTLHSNGYFEYTV